MDDKLEINVQDGKTKFLLLKHYNTLLFTEEKKQQVARNNPETEVCLHGFRLSDMVGVFEPFLDYIRNGLNGISEEAFDRMLDECGVYSLHKSVFRSFLETGVCARSEPLLIDEVAFEQDKIASAVVNLVSHIVKDGHVVFLLNDIQYAGGSSFHFIHNLLEDENCNNISVVAAYNEAKVPLPHIQPLWTKFYGYIFEKHLVTEINCGTLENQRSTLNDFVFITDRIGVYIAKINNLLFCLDFSQAKYYLEIIYKMITVEEIEIDWNHKCEIVMLYTLVSIYTQDFSQALLLCEKLKVLRNQTCDQKLDCAYYYFMGMAHMYNGKLDEADRYAGKFLEIAEARSSDYGIFIAKLLGVMVKMSGWHNIFFCASDIAVDEDVIRMAENYHFWNHLAHIYAYAYDNAPALFSDADKVEERLVYFNKGISIMKRLGNEYFMMEAYRNNIMIASTNGFFKTANYYYDKCHELVRGRNAYEEAMIYNGVGYISSAMEQYDRALHCYNKALTSFLQMEKIDFVGETLYNMAINCIMAQDYLNAYEYLELSFRIVKETKMNSLRVCNISKLAGLLALCSYYNGNQLKCAIYIEKTRLFLEHLIDKQEDEEEETTIIHDYTMCKDDLFIYYFIYGLQLASRKEYDEALRNFQLAEGCLDESAGNQFYIYGQYMAEFASLYRILGRENEAVQCLNAAIGFYDFQGCKGKVAELKAELVKKSCLIKERSLNLSQGLRHEIDEVLRHASVFKENQEQQKRMNFLSAWQKMVEIGGKSKKELIHPSVNAFIHNFNIDRLMLVKYDGNESVELYNNTGYAFENERRSRIEGFFHRNRLGFATSKMNNNYRDYLDIISLFDKKKVCSIIGLPFYYNDSLKAIMVAYITMKDNWHSPTNRYLLDESDYAVFEFLIRQLLNSIDMLEANEKIQQMNDKLNHLAVTDKLTGLYNREGFYGNITGIIGRSKGKAKPITIMYIDLDNFKFYNDTFGHGVGDIILTGMSQIFCKETGENGFVTRYGGDEFLITVYTDDLLCVEQLAKNIYSDIEQAGGFTGMIWAKLGKRVEIPEEHRISCSIGISSRKLLGSEEELENMVKEADKVLYDVKKSGKAAYKFYAAGC
ncbi:MAG: GGDEF domain-containing protein [Lachnospiraceae bacterium]